MTPVLVRTIGWVLALAGIVIVVFSSKIVFPGLELLLGIETIVGKNNVVYRDDGSYIFTNPGAMAEWILSVASIGVVVCIFGIWLLIRSRTRKVD